MSVKPAPRLASYFDKKLSISLQVPEGWSVAAHPQFDLLILSPAERGYRSNLGFSQVAVDDLTPESLRAIIARTKAEQQADYANFQQLEERDFWLDGRPAYLQRYQWQPEGGQRFSQLLAAVAVSPQALLEIHGATLQPLAPRYLPLLLEILGSLRFIPRE